MYTYYYSELIDTNFYDNKININKLDIIIKKYDLLYKGFLKEYWINNILIISSSKTIKFKKIIDDEIKYEQNYLIHKFIEKECKPFNFYETHTEEKYELYESNINNIKILCKKYDEYITLQFISENIININNFLYYNNI